MRGPPSSSRRAKNKWPAILPTLPSRPAAQDISASATASATTFPQLREAARRYPERQDCWHVYYLDVHVGTIAIRTGVPHHEDPWGWICGFLPGQRTRRMIKETSLCGHGESWLACVVIAARNCSLWARGRRPGNQRE